MNTKDLMTEFLNALLTAGASTTSNQYMALVIDTILKSNYTDHPMLRNVKIIVAAQQVQVSIDSSINFCAPCDVVTAISAIIRGMKKPFNAETFGKFKKMVKMNMTKNAIDELLKMNVGFE